MIGLFLYIWIYIVYNNYFWIFYTNILNNYLNNLIYYWNIDISGIKTWVFQMIIFFPKFVRVPNWRYVSIICFHNIQQMSLNLFILIILHTSTENKIYYKSRYDSLNSYLLGVNKKIFDFNNESLWCKIIFSNFTDTYKSALILFRKNGSHIII